MSGSQWQPLVSSEAVTARYQYQHQTRSNQDFHLSGVIGGCRDNTNTRAHHGYPIIGGTLAPVVMMILIQYTQSTVLNALPVCPRFKVRSRFLAKYFVSANRRAGLIAWSPNNWSHLFSIVTICRTLSWKRSFYGKHVSEEVRITITIVIFCYVWIKDGMHAEYVMHSEYSVYTFSEMFLFKCGVKHLTQASHFSNSSLHFKSPYFHSSSFCMFIAQSISGRPVPQPPDH